MNFGMITLNQNIEMEQNYVTDMDTDSFAIYIKTEIFIKTLLMMLKNGLIHLLSIKMIKDFFQQIKTKKYQK